jgi:hypothetical protein
MVHFVGDYSYFMWKMRGENKVKVPSIPSDTTNIYYYFFKHLFFFKK